MPNAFPSAVTTTNQLMGLFCQKFLTNHYGGISDFVCEFVEDDQGVCYFLKLADYQLEPRKEHQKEWQTSKLFPTMPPMSWEVDSDDGYLDGCSLAALCDKTQK
jgi:hypothetical protein